MSLEKINQQSGFTLVELAMVLVIIGVLLGGFISSLAARIETSQRKESAEQLGDIKTAILGFASAEGRLPCPAVASPAVIAELGMEQPVGGGPCTSQHGFVPGKTLGLEGTYNLDNLLLDTWGNPIRYSVTNSDVSAFTTDPGVGGMDGVGMSVLSPDLSVCNAVNVAGDDCLATQNQLISNAPFVVLSLGKDGADFVDAVVADTDQGENAGEIVVAENVAGENVKYTVANDLFFVSRSYSTEGSSAGQFDDIVLWVSPYVLYSQMIEAGQLP